MRSFLPLLALSVLAATSSQAEEDSPDLEVALCYISESIYGATRMAWAPDDSGRLFVVTMRGEVRVIVNGVESPTAFISEHLNHYERQGMLGIAFDPDFANNHYVYFFAALPNFKLQIFRYTDAGGIGVDRTVIVEDIPAGDLDYDGGGLTFGPDGMLYFGVGDLHGYGPEDDLTQPTSKIHRVRPDGTIPTDNPFYDGDGPNVDSTWARGFRNLYGLAFQPGTGRLWANVSGRMANQIFSVSRGDHGGWGPYENNQPEGYLAPVHSYLPNGVFDEYPFAQQAGAVRQNGVATFTLGGTYYESYAYRKGTRLTIVDVEDPSFNGDFYVTGHPDSRTFTVDQPEPDAVSGGGGLLRRSQGEFIMGGMFYEGLRFPESYRGNYLFTDFRGMLHRIRFAADGSVATEDIIVNREPSAGFVDVNEGPDGALYLLSYQGGVLRVTPVPVAQALIVSPLDLSIPEGETKTVMVSLAMPPTVDVWVKVDVQGGEGDLTVAEGGSLRFTRENWSVPQFVTLSAARDADADVEHASFTFTPTQAFPAVTVQARTVEAETQSLQVSESSLAMDEGAQAAFTVALAYATTVPVTVTVARTSGDAEVSFPEGATLTFAPGEGETPKTVTVAATLPATSTDDTAVLTVSALGLESRAVTVTVRALPDADAGMSVDAGTGGDAGGVDAGAEADAGPRLDAGSGHDAGTVPSPMEDESGGCSAGAAALPVVLGGWLMAGLMWRPRRIRR
ncbi:PQQ-dependent sugar dehydrogenase [Corallococcus silvisoli]|uniref:PQQ-dependent sugar dehydrogenase n=1 Tax=Corallococcus silvisoli TaxID=2697031 RepID=UPI0013772174|nr:PQQ-dependent sugar dehydrogenase [Corallococcus silvisoli]NBD11016.1 hypothetical protein [Corallococcus silvisoli]